MSDAKHEKTDKVLFSVASLSKSYGQTKALRSCSFSVNEGEVHAIIGENGAGKSTLVKILTGILAPDSGNLMVRGAEYSRFKSPKEARRVGVGTAMQELLIVPGLTLLDNIWLGAEPSLIRNLPESRRRQQASSIFEELSGAPAPLDKSAGDLDLSQQQLCVIARAFLTEPSIVLLDEPTAALDVHDRDRLFEVIRKRMNKGIGVIFISHRMDEIMNIADKVTVLRGGETITTLNKADVTPEELVRLMSGETKLHQQVVKDRKIGPVKMRIQGLQLKEDTGAIDVELHEGEILGVGGLEGHGQEQFITSLVGLHKARRGTVSVVDGSNQRQIKSLTDAANQGVVYIPRSRKTEGIFEPMSLVDNFALPSMKRYRSGPFLKTSRILKDFNHYREQLSIRMSGPQAAISTLSGGNQQKVLVARWLNTNPNIIVFNDPTRGVDPKTKTDLYRTTRELTDRGIAVVFLSTDVEELLTLVDRVLIFRDGCVSAEIKKASMSRNLIVSAFFGQVSEPLEAEQ